MKSRKKVPLIKEKLRLKSEAWTGKQRPLERMAMLNRAHQKKGGLHQGMTTFFPLKVQGSAFTVQCHRLLFCGHWTLNSVDLLAG
jgi:hypothetical protein